MRKSSLRLKRIIETDRKEIIEEKYKPVKDLLEKNNYKPKFLSLFDLKRSKKH